MANDDEAARRARADSLRQRIATLKSGHTAAKVPESDSEASGRSSEIKPADETAPLGESPREFVQRKMRELDRKKSDNGPGDA
jgi:hypothetical protein